MKTFDQAFDLIVGSRITSDFEKAKEVIADLEERYPFVEDMRKNEKYFVSQMNVAAHMARLLFGEAAPELLVEEECKLAKVLCAGLEAFFHIGLCVGMEMEKNDPEMRKALTKQAPGRRTA